MPPKRVKTEKGTRESTARRSVRPSQAEDDVEMDNAQEPEEDDEAAKLERVLATIANYPDQPIEAIQEPKIRSIGAEITAHNQLYSQAIEAMTETAVMLADALPGGEDPFENEEILKIKESLLDLLDKQHAVALHMDALDTEVRKPVGAGRKIVDPETVFKEGIDKRLESYNSQTARQKYGKSKAFRTFIEGIWESSHSEAMPPAMQFLPKEEGDPEDSDDDLEVGGVTQDYRCPLTLKIYTDPLTSTICGHTFSADAIRDYVLRNDKCPGTGCNARISMSVLKLDRGIQKKAIAAERRAQKNDEGHDGSDIEDDD